MSAASAATRAQRDVVRGIADAAARSLDAGDLSGSINQLIHAMRACVSTAAEELPALPRVPSVYDEPQNVFVERRSQPRPAPDPHVTWWQARDARPCRDCPPGTAPHLASHYFSWRVGSEKHSARACERRVFEVRDHAMAEQHAYAAKVAP